VLNPSSPLPLYHQLAELLAADMDGGRYPHGERLPSEHDLAKRYGLGRPTVRQATELLMRRGLVERRRGAGTFVRAPRPRADLFSLVGTQHAFRAEGTHAETRVLSPLSSVSVPARADNPFAGRQALFLSRLSRAEKTPVVFEQIFFCPETFSQLMTWDLQGQSLSDLVEQRLNLRPESAEQRFSVAPVHGKVARTLGVSSGTPLLFVQRHIHFRIKRQAIYVELYCCTDRMNFTQTIEGPDHA